MIFTLHKFEKLDKHAEMMHKENRLSKKITRKILLRGLNSLSKTPLKLVRIYTKCSGCGHDPFSDKELLKTIEMANTLEEWLDLTESKVHNH